MKIESNLFRDYPAESALFVRRTLVAIVVILLLTGVLIVNLYHLQINRVEDYRTRSNENRIKLVPIAPSRGIIYDRNGIPLALNRTIYQLELMPEKIENLPAILKALKPIVELNDDDIVNFNKERQRSRRFMSVPLKSSLTDVQVARFVVNQFRFPGVEIKSYQQRYYPYGSALAHVIGYVSRINEKDVEHMEKEGILANYAATQDTGKLGIERFYESVLHGKIGYEEVEINNRGRLIRRLHEQPPQAGKDIWLTLDLNLQIHIEQLLAGSRAAVVVSDPRTGGILALVSTPGYDPNLFVKNIPGKAYQALLNDPNRPLINRATQGIYSPGSTVKPYIAVSALSAGVINKETTLFDPGWWQLPGSEKRYRDWKKTGHGRVNVTKALEESSDTFFYQLAYKMGIDKLSEWMSKFGYGDYTGIDLAEERAGIMPTREWKQKRYNKNWYQGDTIPVGIGQGYWTATPVQMAKALTTLINDGHVKTPHLLLHTQINDSQVFWKQQEQRRINDIHADYWGIAKDGMFGVANRSNGTGRHFFAGTPYKAAAKSGTVQVYSYETYNASKVAEHLRDHKLMMAFAPFEKPTIAVAVILENGGAGPTVGAITRQILDHVLLDDKKPVVRMNANSTVAGITGHD